MDEQIQKNGVKVSILVPVYNVEKFLNQCIDSILAQTLQDIEIICINDGSTDSSLQILQEYQKKDSRIKIINKKNTGYGHSMNCGLKVATGEYIGIVESDDFIDANMFASLYDTVKNNNVDIVKSNFFRYKNKYNIQSTELDAFKLNVPIVPIDYLDIFIRQPSIWSGIYRRDFLLENNIYFNETPGASYQDTAFYFKVISCAKKMILLQEAFYHYRLDNDNSSVHSISKVYCVCDEYDEFEKFLSKCLSIKKRLLKFIPVMKYVTFSGNYIRLRGKNKSDFLCYMIKEFKKYKRKGLLNKKYWDEYAWNNVMRLVSIENGKELYYARLMTQNIVIHRDGALARVNKANKVIIYGAGAVGMGVLDFLQNNNVGVYSFAVSNTKDNRKDIYGIPVCSIDDLDVDKKNTIILISVKDKDQSEILNNLLDRGYENIMLMTKRLRQYLQGTFCWE